MKLPCWNGRWNYDDRTMVGEEAEIVCSGNSFAERFPRRFKLEISERKRAGASGYEELMRSRESIRIERNDPKI